VDGIPDFWEEAYFGGPTNAVASVDIDGDGYSNLEEYNAQTDPGQALSVLQIESIARPLDWEISFEGELGRQYALEANTNLSTGSWSTVGGPVGGTGTVMSITYTNSPDGTSFRVTASRP